MNDPQWVGNVLGGTEYIGTHVVQFIVEAASVAHRLSVLIPPPQGGGCSLAVGAARTLPPGGRLKVLRLSRTCKGTVEENDVRFPASIMLIRLIRYHH